MLGNRKIMQFKFHVVIQFNQLDDDYGFYNNCKTFPRLKNVHYKHVKIVKCWVRKKGK